MLNSYAQNLRIFTPSDCHDFISCYGTSQPSTWTSLCLEAPPNSHFKAKTIIACKLESAKPTLGKLLLLLLAEVCKCMCNMIYIRALSTMGQTPWHQWIILTWATSLASLPHNRGNDSWSFLRILEPSVSLSITFASAILWKKWKTDIF